MANIFNKGDVVVLKSGGPKMTVQQVIEEFIGPGAEAGTLLCIWFDGSKQHTGYFDPELLKVPTTKPIGKGLSLY